MLQGVSVDIQVFKIEIYILCAPESDFLGVVYCKVFSAVNQAFFYEIIRYLSPYGFVIDIRKY